jgi:acetoin utilization deacetylase AcuC-like enzyme
LEEILARLRREPWPLVERAGDQLSDPAVEEAVLAVHDPAYAERFRAAVERGDGLIDSADNPLSAGSWEAARGAVAAALAAADWMMEGSGRTAFAAVRPPGHHAERAMAMGFCYFNNVAVAAERLIRHHGLARVAIFDFDVHHGNGTQHLFEDRADVLYASVHQHPFYPGTGAASETGRGQGAGSTLNVPLPAGSGDDVYLEVFEGRILPWLRQAAPEALLVSAGFDAWRGDPLGGMRVSEEGFERWGRLLGELAGEVCSGRVLSFLEGGYDLRRLPELVVAYLRGLEAAAGSAPVETPVGASAERAGGESD